MPADLKLFTIEERNLGTAINFSAHYLWENPTLYDNKLIWEKSPHEALTNQIASKKPQHRMLRSGGDSPS